MQASVCNTHVSATAHSNNGTFKNLQEALQTAGCVQAILWAVLCLKDCSQGAGYLVQLASRAARLWRRSPTYGHYGLVANNQGMEASCLWDCNAISWGCQVLRDGFEVKRDGGRGLMGLEKGEYGVGKFFFPSTLPTCSRASKLAPSRQTPTFCSWVTQRL